MRNSEKKFDVRTDLKQNIYEHGGSRIYFENEDNIGGRTLIADTYMDAEFAEYIRDCTRKYYGRGHE